MSMSVLIALIACRPAPEVAPGLEPPPPQQQKEGPELVAMDDLPNLWTVSEGWSKPMISRIEDLDGDGVEDAVVVLSHVDGGDRVALLAGPLLAEHVLPDDAYAWFDNMAPYYGDFDGDMVVDLGTHVNNETGVVTFVPGPLVGAVDFTVQQEALYTTHFDDDGVADLVIWDSSLAVHVWRGPDINPAAEPDLTIAFSCPGAPPNYAAYSGEIRFWPDLDGDGVRDGYTPGFARQWGCMSTVFPIPESGFLDAIQDPAAVVGVMPFFPVPDQNGDGLPDLYLPDERRFLGSPITFRADEDLDDGLFVDPDGSDLGTISPDLDGIRAQTVDFTGDGIADFIGATLSVPPAWDGGTTSSATPADFAASGLLFVPVAGGPEGLAVTVPEQVYELGDAWGFHYELQLLDGHAWMIVERTDGLLFVDFGEATAIEGAELLRWW